MRNLLIEKTYNLKEGKFNCKKKEFLQNSKFIKKDFYQFYIKKGKQHKQRFITILNFYNIFLHQNYSTFLR